MSPHFATTGIVQTVYIATGLAPKTYIHNPVKNSPNESCRMHERIDEADSQSEVALGVRRRYLAQS